MNLVILGPQGCGKGTQSKLISQKYGLTHISTGDILREEIGKNSEDGIYASSIMNNGHLVPDELVLKLLDQKLKSISQTNGFLLDGYPRNLEQAKQLDKIAKIDKAILIDMERKEVLDRLSGRLVCDKCGLSTHKCWVKSTKCSKCGGKLITRADDTEQSINQRLNTYFETTLPLVDYYNEKGIVYQVDGRGSVDEVFKQIENTLGGKS